MLQQEEKSGFYQGKQLLECFVCETSSATATVPYVVPMVYRPQVTDVKP